MTTCIYTLNIIICQEYTADLCIDDLLQILGTCVIRHDPAWATLTEIAANIIIKARFILRVDPSIATACI